MENEPFDAGAALAQLKRFQRRTVEYVFDRLHGADPVRQFLVADEVGLGKTMVARGVIAKTIEALWNRSKRIDILYICSNQAIAAQNLNRLNVLGKRAMALPTRMTLVPLQLRGEQDLSANKVNFISLTPGTTFNLRSTTGVVEERALLHRLLEAMGFSFTPLRNALQVDAGNGRWDACVGSMSLEGIDPTIVSNFHDAVRQDASLLSAIDEMISLFPRRQPTYPDEKRWKRNEVIGALRSKLSHACVSALKPDLIILDEFQRFRELLRGEGEPAELARALFDYSDDTASARTLLLSATPYKMLTLSGDEPDDGDHYEDFLETIEFLYGRDKGATIKVELDREMRRFRKLLQQLPTSATDAKRARNKVQRTLKRVMARTERVGSTAERDSMLAEPSINVPLAPADLHQAEAFARVARAVDAREIIEYWKSAPYLLNFMRDYTLKHRLKDKAANSNPALISALSDAQALGISREQVEAYQPIDPANGRLRALMADLFDSGLHQHLWLPPAVTYYGPASEGTPATKALVFSAWQMVPDALAALLSYEAERRMGAASVVRSYSEATRRRPLQFKLVDGRPAAMRALHLIYPSPTLARICDPLSVFSGAPEQLSVEEMRAAIADRIRTALGHLFAKENGEEAAGRDAEWSTPATIDVLLKTKSSGWLQYLGYRWTIQEEGFREHIAELRRTATEASLGELDNDTLDLLVDVALGSPAVCALRALHRIAPGLAWDDPHLMDAAASIAWGFRAFDQFGLHDIGSGAAWFCPRGQGPAHLASTTARKTTELPGGEPTAKWHCLAVQHSPHEYSEAVRKRKRPREDIGMKSRYFCGASLVAAGLWLGAAGSAAAQAELPQVTELETVVVTGSLIAGTPEDAAIPVTVISNEEIEKRGTPNVVELIKQLPISGPVLGDSNQFSVAGQLRSGGGTINIRGLGAQRTLVLMNGRRFSGGVADTNLLPIAAIGRVEVLKDGAAATYGSDAIGGVVNFLTRRNFEGLELQADYRHVGGSKGDYSASALYGWRGDTTNLLVSVAWQHRSELSITDRDWPLQPYLTNPSGWSILGNPGAWTILRGATPVGFAVDANCAAVGGFAGFTGNTPACYFPYLPFVNLVETQDQYQVYAEFNADVGESAEFHVEALYSQTNVPHIRFSPGYPPTSGPNGPGSVNVFSVPASNPGFNTFLQQTGNGALVGTATGALATLWRPFANGGNNSTGGLGGQSGSRKFEELRISANLNGETGLMG